MGAYEVYSAYYVSEKLINELKEKGNPVIITHEDSFHLDELLACLQLKRLEKYKNSAVVRTRNAELIGMGDIVVDVGGTYDPENLRFDHHQRTFSELFNDLAHTKMSSAGMIWKHFGEQILRDKYGISDSDEIKQTHEAIYKYFFENVDASDNGVKSCPCTTVAYRGCGGLGFFVNRLNPNWNDEQNEDQSFYFMRALEFLEPQLELILSFFANGYCKAKEYYTQLMDEAIREEKRYIIVTKYPEFSTFFADWNRNGAIHIIVTSTDNGDCWIATCVNKGFTSMSNHTEFHNMYRGLSGSLLKERFGFDGLYSVSPSSAKADTKNHLICFISQCSYVNAIEPLSNTQ